MTAVQGKVTAFISLTKESLDGASDSLDGDREIKRRLIDWQAQHDDKAVVNCFCKTTASARLSLYLKRLYFISSAITFCISPYASFYAGLSCNQNLLHGLTDWQEVTKLFYHTSAYQSVSQLVTGSICRQTYQTSSYLLAMAIVHLLLLMRTNLLIGKGCSCRCLMPSAEDVNL